LTPQTFVIVVGFLFGIAIGSFLNVVIWRWPRRESIVFPVSHCPQCQAAIRWYDNLPLLSWLLLGGKCRHCGGRISLRYPLVELISGLFLAAYLYKYGIYRDELVILGRFESFGKWTVIGIIPGVVWYFFTAALLVITFIDLDHKLIPDAITLPGIPLGLAVNAFLFSRTWHEGLVQGGLGVLLGGGVLLSIAVVHHWLTKVEGMGGGDPKLMAMIGAFFGPAGVLFTMLASSFVGALIGILVIYLGGKDRRLEIPFGPFISLGAILWLWIGPLAKHWYWGHGF